jgi:hypothetical protein
MLIKILTFINGNKSLTQIARWGTNGHQLVLKDVHCMSPSVENIKIFSKSEKYS